MAKTTSNPPEDDGDKLEIILPVVLIGLSIIVVCAVIFVLYRRSKKENARALPHKASITMRDRLRAESLKSLDSRLLRLYDPDKLKQYRLDQVAYVKDLGEGFFGKVFQGKWMFSSFESKRMNNYTKLPSKSGGYVSNTNNNYSFDKGNEVKVE